MNAMKTLNNLSWVVSPSILKLGGWTGTQSEAHKNNPQKPHCTSQSCELTLVIILDAINFH
jgi:hypothetical protein